MIKVSFLGDIMCEEPFLLAAKTENGGYDFTKSFTEMKPLGVDADYVIGNLESPFAGPDYKYTHEMYSFNTPDCFVDAVKDMGVDFVLTANNHCCDRGIDGLKRTLKVLDKCGLKHTGTYEDKEGRNPVVVEIGDTKIAIISCTSSTNASRTKCKADTENVNLLQEQFVKLPMKGKKAFVSALKTFIVKRIIGEKCYIKLRVMCGLSPKKPSTDNSLNKEAVNSYLEEIKSQIEKARQEADIVFVCPHMGGQFNKFPGAFSEYVIEYLTKVGADAVVASHPHIIQKVEMKNGVPCAFSLGNVSMSMSSLYIVKDELPDYGMMLHFYIEERKICQVTYSLIKMEEDAAGYLFVSPVAMLYQKANEEKRREILGETQRVVQRIMQDEDIRLKSIPEEFDLF